ncbi:MAG: metal-dependent hydrolase [Candidatus Rokuibacteriota bacterium]
MQAPTHAAFGLVFVILAGTVLGILLTPPVAAFACLGALLPDIDTPTSLVGKACLPLSRFLERRFGHRTLTHSFLGLALFVLPVLPLGLFDRQWPLAFALGYLSHLLVDCANKSGTPLFYPSQLRAVLPRSEEFRIAVGSGQETVLLVILLVALAVLLPLHQIGFSRALHALTQTTTAAISDYRGWQGRWEVWAEVDGIFQLSQRRVSARYRILGIAGATTLIVLDPATGRIHTVGANKESNLYPYRIRAQQGRPITVRSRQVTLTQQLLKDLLREVPPEGETYFQGTVKTPDTPVLRQDPEQYEVLKHGLHELELRFARPRDLQDPQVGNLFVLSGLVFVQTVVPDEPLSAPSPPTQAAPAEFDDITQLFIAHVTDPSRELLVGEGERVRKGQLLARLTYRDQELERRMRHAEARIEEKEAALALQAAKVRQARALVGAGLAAPGAVEREEAGVLRARVAVEQERRELARLAEEAARLSEVRSPVDGQVLTIRVHVIHGSESTAVLRLLYRKGSQTDDR